MIARTKYSIRLIAVLCIASPPVFADDRIDAIFEEFTEAGSPGAAVAVMQHGEMLYEQGYGSAQLEYDIPITLDTIFHVASVSKQFAAFAVVLLDEEGELSLDDDIRTHIPEIPDFGDTITIRHLIFHTSGLRDQWSLLQAAGWRMEDVITMDDILKLITNQRELNFPPGDAHVYCNTGYTLLGVIVERVVGKSLKSFCAERIFEPLGMSKTHFHDDHRHLVPNRAYSYARNGDGFEKRVLSYANAGATSLFTTAGDLLRWQRNFESPKVGGAKAIQAMREHGTLNDGREISYGFGLSHGSLAGMDTVLHGGADAGFRSFLLWIPEKEFSVAIVSNLANVDSGDLAFSVAAEYLLEGSDGPPKTEAPEVAPDVSLRAYKGIYLYPEGNLTQKLVHSGGVLKLVSGLSLPIPLERGSDTTFRPAQNPDTLLLEFNLNRKSEVEALYLTTQTAVRRKFQPVDPPERSREFLEELVGRYYSTELDVTYDVVLESRNLTMETRKQAPMVLQPQFRDGFNWDGYLVRFERDGRGRITGFRLNTGRILNLRFDRLD